MNRLTEVLYKGRVAARSSSGVEFMIDLLIADFESITPTCHTYIGIGNLDPRSGTSTSRESFSNNKLGHIGPASAI